MSLEVFPAGTPHCDYPRGRPGNLYNKRPMSDHWAFIPCTEMDN